MKNKKITLDEGGGGYKSFELVKDIRKILNFTGNWTNCEDDSAVFDLNNFILDNKSSQKLVFTTDAFIVTPVFFPGGDIGKISMCGTINDLAVMGAKPIGISLSIIVEEGFPKSDFDKILRSIDDMSKEAGVPVVTGDTKVMDSGKVDKITITTAGVGLADRVIENNGIMVGDNIITSGDLGEHAVMLLANRFNYKTKIKSDSKPINKELEKVSKYLNSCKDPTRGGLGANLVEMAKKSNVKVILDEDRLPYKKEVVAVSELLGIDIFSLASEGRFIASVSKGNTKMVLDILKEFNDEASIIGVVEDGDSGVYLKTKIGGLRPIEMPKGKLIPRIC